MPPGKRKRGTGLIDQPSSDSPDLLSALPDAVLASIFSRVPIKDLVRTSILSSRWRHVWKGSPLRIDDSIFRKPTQKRLHLTGWHEKSPCEFDWQQLDPDSWNEPSSDAVFSIFKSHYGPVESLSLSQFSREIFFSDVDGFVESAVRRGIRELTLVFGYLYSYQLLPSLLQCKSLRQLSLRSCQLPDPIPPFIFPNVKELRLNRVNLTADSLQILLSSCRSLETLHLLSTFKNFTVVSISSRRLRKLVWGAKTKDLIIEDAPILESLMLCETLTTYCNVKVCSAPKLQLLGFLNLNFRALQLSQTYIEIDKKGKITVTPPYGFNTLSSVKTLAIKIVATDNLDTVIPTLFRCFPCLENLDILKFDDTYNFGYGLYQGFWKELDTFCLLDHLKTVTVKRFNGHQNEVEFLRYLVTRGRVLRKITILYSKYMNKEFLDTKWLQIRWHKRASSDLELFFYEDNRFSEHFSLWNELIEH